MMKIRARRNVRALIRALALALILPARSVGQFQILSPRPRELFVRLPVPVMIFVGDGEVASDSDIRIVLHVNGVKVLESPPSLLVETSLNDVEEGTNALELSVLKNEEVLQKGGDMFSFNFSVHTAADRDDMIHYIPPKDGARPRFPHFLVSPREGPWERTSDPADKAAAEDELERRNAAVRAYPQLFGPLQVDDEYLSNSDRAEADSDGRAIPGWRSLQKYAARQRAIVRDPALLRDARFLIARHYPTSGLGNMLQSLVSAFLVAFLTDRVFLTDAFLVSEFLEFPRMEGTNYSAVFDLFGGTHVAYHAQYFLYTGVQSWLLCEDLEDMMTNQFAFIESDMYFAGLLVNNDVYSTRLGPLFGDRLFQTIADFLFRPRGSIAAEVMAFHQENLADRQTVGMHIRTHTLGHPGYIEPYALADNRGHFLNSYWKCAHFASGGTGVVALEEAPLIFLAVDNGAVRHEAARVFGGQLVVRDAPIARGHLEGQRAALVEIYLLSLCDEIVTTQMSTFSYVAHALASKSRRSSAPCEFGSKASCIQIPHVVTMQGTCVRDLSSQPCLHAWRHIVLASDCFHGELPIMTSGETRNCGYYTQQSLNAPQNCEWLH